MPGISTVWTGANEYGLNGIPLHAGHETFRFLAAEPGDAQLAGFSYGCAGAPGQWWHDIVAAEMDGETGRRWVPAGHFEFTELHVHPTFRRRGVGGRLHNALLDGLASSATVLTTQTDNDPALAFSLVFYKGRGWEVVVPELFFYANPRQPFCVMGKELR